MTVNASIGLAALLALGAATAAAQTMPQGVPVTDNGFCERVQRDLTGTTLKLNNIVYADFEGFKESKTKIDPIEIGQYVLSDGTSPTRVSCKTKTTDHLTDRYGADAAKGDKTCADINRMTVDAVYGALSDDDKAKLKIAREDVVIEPDETVYMGSQWVTDYDFVYRGPEAKMHLMAKSLYVTWTNIAFKWAPERFRGVRYCHLIAPEYAKRLALGEAELPLPKSN
ncbi:MAG: hypothetical protein SFV19_13635 [Rhodospirillaceae bacterium]|nr:hypothetical protein [Rhodospirillaceae bacterium]